MPATLRISALWAPLAVALCVSTATEAAAQTSSLFGNRGPLSQSASGRSSTGSGSLATGGAGPSSLSGGGGAAAGRGGQSAAPGGRAGGQAGQGAQGGAMGQEQALGQAAPAFGQNGFVGRSDNVGRFIGNDQAGAQQGGRNGQQRGGANRLNLNRGNQNGFNPNGQNGNFGQNGGRTRSSTVIPRQRVAFDYRIRGETTIETSLDRQFQKISTRPTTLSGTAARPSLAALQGVDIECVGAEVVLKGSVQSVEQARLAEALARLEPGVRTIRNELVIRGALPRPPSVSDTE